MRKIFTAILAAALILSISACSKDDTNPAPADNNSAKEPTSQSLALEKIIPDSEADPMTPEGSVAVYQTVSKMTDDVAAKMQDALDKADPVTDQTAGILQAAIDFAYENYDILKDIEVVDSDKNEQADGKGQEDSEAQTDEKDLKEKFSFEDLSEYTFEFCSGAGGWATELFIEKDGSFSFDYHDSEMGVTEDEYPNGMCYLSVGTGHFSDLKQIDEFTYEMNLKDISYEKEIGYEEITDGVLYSYTSCYGLDESDIFRILLPGTKVDGLSDDVKMWVMYSIEDKDELDIPVIVNAANENAFYSYERLSPKEQAKQYLDEYHETEKYFQNEYKEATSVADKCIQAQNFYDQTDYLLNLMWSLVKNSNTEEDFQKYLEEQRKWLKEREQKIVVNEGTFVPDSQEYFDYYSTMADWNMRRCEELVKYVKECEETN